MRPQPGKEIDACFQLPSDVFLGREKNIPFLGKPFDLSEKFVPVHPFRLQQNCCRDKKVVNDLFFTREKWFMMPILTTPQGWRIETIEYSTSPHES